MAVTVIVRVVARHGDGGDTRLTFDGTQRVVIGRGAGSDVRLPDASVSHRHASLRAQGGDFAVVDEGSTNGTYVGEVRIAPHTSRVVRSGDKVRVGRVWLELRMDQTPVTRDVAAATRDLALALVSQAMAAVGTDRTPRVAVVEGRDQGAKLSLGQADRVYVVGRAAHCDLALDDGDCSREHLHVTVRGGTVFIRDQGAKNGTQLGETRAPSDRDVAWRPATMIRIGRTVLALEEPVTHTLAEIEQAPDEAANDAPPPPADPVAPASPSLSDIAGLPVPVAVGGLDPNTTPERAKAKGGWSVTDLLVMAAAVSVLALSLAGLVWLLRG
jgi:pSer/pThr/pTyr-binding forkhead associated (FHA) protein